MRTETVAARPPAEPGPAPRPPAVAAERPQAQAAPPPQPAREDAVETLRYALHGYHVALRRSLAHEFLAARTDHHPGGPDHDPVTCDTPARCRAAARIGGRHRLLDALGDEQALDTAGLARVASLDETEVRALLAEFGREGLVEFAPQPRLRDRSGGAARPGALRLTARGRMELDRIETSLRLHWERDLDDLSVDELRHAARVLSRISLAMQR
ncbi:hypothetical protein [Allostreptomyces psammosilenae]|uniref:MarR family transcriptional regulator n=1 Tax=Allostreptomyces psammosilenae TaxID=1892865 RepID=A0A852ZLJ6_9ACTN|nr:hypothetical protein [Allostreptomyces psammosilenae]NYI03269.1 hypothetical protein [Allostreptomyces psammosilenae]